MQKLSFQSGNTFSYLPGISARLRHGHCAAAPVPERERVKPRFLIRRDFRVMPVNYANRVQKFPQKIANLFS